MHSFRSTTCHLTTIKSTSSSTCLSPMAPSHIGSSRQMANCVAGRTAHLLTSLSLRLNPPGACLRCRIHSSTPTATYNTIGQRATHRAYLLTSLSPRRYPPGLSLVAHPQHAAQHPNHTLQHHRTASYRHCSPPDITEPASYPPGLSLVSHPQHAAQHPNHNLHQHWITTSYEHCPPPDMTEPASPPAKFVSGGGR
jgi:hypothetical protein